MYWVHAKQKNMFTSTYEASKKDRVFTLTEVLPTDSKKKSKVISFESWQQAKRVGWTKLKTK